MTAVPNPFVWDRPLEDPVEVVGMDAFAQRVALTLKRQTNVALFAPSGAGKTTFTNRLALELAKEHGPDAPPFDVVTINLQRVVSLPGLIGCVHDAMTDHPAGHMRAAARGQLAVLERETGFDIRAVRGSIRASRSTPTDSAALLHAQLLMLRALSRRLVVIFDDFQGLRRCPGDPPAIIRSALMSASAGQSSVLVTGSIRSAPQMPLEDGRRLPFDHAARLALPAISPAELFEYLDSRFEGTGKPATEEAISYILAVTGAHPRSTQQLAWQCWSRTPDGEGVALTTAVAAHDRLVQSIGRSQFSAALDILISGDDSEINEVRALQLLADRGGETLTSRTTASLYGFSSHARVKPSLERLRRRGLVDEREGGWYIVDPLFAEWLRRASPLACG